MTGFGAGALVMTHNEHVAAKAMVSADSHG